jgi:squalene synthase HpnC
LPVAHYENFPVASWLVPARLRRPIEAIYDFARGADDIADEGDLDDAARLRGLAAYRRALDEIVGGGTPAEAPFARLAEAVREHALPVPLLRDLIDAFSQDVVKKRYATFAELLDYSRRSANPVGRLVLHLVPDTTPLSLSRSDLICSALQLVNFWQDVAVDWAKGRVYIPQEDLERFGVAEAQIAAQRADERWRALMEFQCARARAMLVAGAPLGHALPGRLGIEIRATEKGGIAIADKIVARGGDVFRNRPVLGTRDWIRIVAGAVMKRHESGPVPE